MRQWTIDALNEVHPLRPAGGRTWTWEIWSGQPVAISEGGMRWVTIDKDGGVFGAVDLPRTPGAWATRDRFDPPTDIALAVILASKGLDSREAIADALAGMSDVAVLTEAVAMVRRGKVNP